MRTLQPLCGATLLAATTLAALAPAAPPVEPNREGRGC